MPVYGLFLIFKKDKTRRFFYCKNACTQPMIESFCAQKTAVTLHTRRCKHFKLHRLGNKIHSKRYQTYMN